MNNKLEDITLVSQVALFHNKRAFDKLVMKYEMPIRRFFLGQTLGNESLSDDLAQETFIKAYTNIQNFKGLSQFSTWLYKIAYNTFYDYTRKKPPTQELPANDVLTQRSEKIMADVSIDIYKALTLLNEKERLCVTLQLIDGLPIDKIAKITGLVSGTIKSHLSRGKEKLANYLKKNGYDE